MFTPPNLSVLLAVAYNPPPPPAAESAHVIELKGDIVSENCTTKHCSVIFEITLLQRECSHPLFVAELDLKVVFPGSVSRWTKLSLATYVKIAPRS